MSNKILKKHHINPDHFRVTIFGSARIKPNDPRYNQVYQLAKRIAHKDYDIVTGGGPGIMEAANKGHQDGRKKGSDVHSYGLTIMLPYEDEANPQESPEQRFEIPKEPSRFGDYRKGRLPHSLCERRW